MLSLSHVSQWLRRVSGRCMLPQGPVRLDHVAPLVLPDKADFGIRIEPMLPYKRNSVEAMRLENSLTNMKTKLCDVPIVINGQEVRNRNVRVLQMPHHKKDAIAQYYYADQKNIMNGILEACEAQRKWQTTSFSRRIAIWETAANILAKKRRIDIVAAIMLGQAKTVVEAEKDLVKLIDTIRLHVDFVRKLDRSSALRADSKINQSFIHFRGFDGFVAAITPFYCTATALTLALMPALMGCTVLWRPADAAILSNWLIFQVMRESGLPEGVINFIPADELSFIEQIASSPNLSGVNFAGSTPTYRTLLHNITRSMHQHRHIPQVHGDCVDGKNIHFIHRSADADVALASTIRAAFEYSGQKPESCSHVFVSDRLWADELERRFIEVTQRLFLGDVSNFKCFMSAVIDENAFARNYEFIENVKIRNKGQIVAGGVSCPLRGFFIDPTIVVVLDPHERLLRETVTGPILIVHPYKERNCEKVIMLIENSGLMRSGAAFAKDKQFLRKYVPRLQTTSTRYFINESCTGDIERKLPLFQQPHQLLRWTRVQAVRDCLHPIAEPFNADIN